MSSTHNLYLQTNYPSKEIAEILFRGMNITFKHRTGDHDFISFNGGKISGSIFTPDEPDYLDPVGFIPNRVAIFHWKSDYDDDVRGYIQEVQAMRNWLTNNDSNCFFLLNGELPLIVRQKGNLYINSNTIIEDWERAFLIKNIALPHTLKHFPVL